MDLSKYKPNDSASLLDFFRDYDIDADVAFIVREKINLANIKHLSEEQLQKVVPALGDRIKINQLLNGEGNTNLKPEEKEKKSLALARLQEKFGSTLDTADIGENKEVKIKMVTVEVGWMHRWSSNQVGYDTVHPYPYGGGNRRAVVPINSTYYDLIDSFKDCYFDENGNSDLGSITELSFTILDGRKKPIDENFCLKKLFDKGHYRPKLYLASTGSKNRPKRGKKVKERPRKAKDPFLTESSDDSNDADFAQPPPKILRANYDATRGTINYDAPPSTSNESVYLSDNDVLPEPIKKETITVRRMDIFHDLIRQLTENFFENDCEFFFKIIGANGEQENGIDLGGVGREVISKFWDHFFENFTKGCDSKIPHLSIKLSETDWKKVAFILKKGYVQYNFFPVSMSQTFMEKCIFNEVVSDKIKDLNLWLPAEKRIFLENVMIDESYFEKEENKQQLYDLFSYLEIKSIPQSFEKFMKELNNVAELKMIQETTYIRSIWSGVLNQFIDYETLEDFYKKSSPTPDKILDIIKLEKNNLTADEEISFLFLKKYIKESDINNCIRLLCHITGANIIIPGRSIIVAFHDQLGIAYKSCDNKIILPNTSSLNYAEFEQHLKNNLNDPEMNDS